MASSFFILPQFTSLWRKFRLFRPPSLFFPSRLLLWSPWHCAGYASTVMDLWSGSNGLLLGSLWLLNLEYYGHLLGLAWFVLGLGLLLVSGDWRLGLSLWACYFKVYLWPNSSGENWSRTQGPVLWRWAQRLCTATGYAPSFTYSLLTYQRLSLWDFRI